MSFLKPSSPNEVDLPEHFKKQAVELMASIKAGSAQDLAEFEALDPEMSTSLLFTAGILAIGGEIEIVLPDDVHEAHLHCTDPDHPAYLTWLAA